MSNPWHSLILGLGANLGDRETTLRQAFRIISTWEATRDWSASPLYDTPPVDVAEPQPAYLNAVIAGETTLDAETLLDRLLALERRMGRTNKGDRQPRTLDIDILALGDTIVDLPRLTLPHPRLHQRLFVLIPLVDVQPTWHHPRLNATAEQLLTALQRETPPEVQRTIHRHATRLD